MMVEIRKACAADLAAVRELLIETWHATYDTIHGAEEVTEITNRWHAIEILAAQLDRRDAAFMVAERGGEIVATSLALRKEAGAVLLSRLYVRPNEQGRGVGHSLLEATLAEFSEASVIHLEVDPQNERAIRFYEARRFIRAGEVRDCGCASGIAALVYERRSNNPDL